MRASMLRAAVLLVVAAPACAAPRDGGDCASAEADRRIAGCTRIIQDLGETARMRAGALINRALAYRAKGELDRAIADYSEAIRLDPRYADAYYNRAIAFKAKGDLDRAIADYNEAIRLNPRDALAYNNRGIAYQAKGDFAGAIIEYDEAIRLDPGNALAHYNRAIAYRSVGDLERAIADYDAAIRLDPARSLAYSQRGHAYQARGDALSALADFCEAIRLDPKNIWAYQNRGIVYLYGGLLDKARADFRQAAELAPKDPYCVLWLEIAERRSGVPGHLAEASRQLTLTAWPGPLVRLFLGETSLAATLAAAHVADATRGRRKACDANLYGAELAILQGRNDEALELYRLAAGECPNDFIEWTAANAALRELGVTPYLQ